MGHLVRSLALAQGLAERVRVVFLNGGKLPRGIKVPETVEVVSLPPLGMDVEGNLVSRDRRRSVERVQILRTRSILQTFETLHPQIIFIELFPFGRKKFAFELMPLLEAAHQSVSRPLILCSVRDILVGKRRDQAHHDERASCQANRLFDGILVHADPRFARLEESFHPTTPLLIPVRYTGFVFVERDTARVSKKQRPAPILVSAGGGLVGEPLFRAAVEAQALLWPELGIPMKIVTGPFFPEEHWLTLRSVAQRQHGLIVRRSVSDLCAEMRTATMSISQCGYNTALDILRARVPSLVVPFCEGREDEQSQRARRLDELGVLRVLNPDRLTPGTLANAIRKLLSFQSRPSTLNLNGAQNTADMVAWLLHQRSQSTLLPATQGVQL
jgi:predicted glycosyltransferase